MERLVHRYVAVGRSTTPIPFRGIHADRGALFFGPQFKVTRNKLMFRWVCRRRL